MQSLNSSIGMPFRVIMEGWLTSASRGSHLWIRTIACSHSKVCQKRFFELLVNAGSVLENIVAKE